MTMTPDEFLDQLRRCGPDLTAWPQAMQSPARRLLETDAALRVTWQASRFDAMLLSVAKEPVPPAPFLAERIIARSHDLLQGRWAAWLDGMRSIFSDFHVPAPAYVLALILGLGFLSGFGLPDGADEADIATRHATTTNAQLEFIEPEEASL